jgi:hypothetical protein
VRRLKTGHLYHTGSTSTAVAAPANKVILGVVEQATLAAIRRASSRQQFDRRRHQGPCIVADSNSFASTRTFPLLPSRYQAGNRKAQRVQGASQDHPPI